MKKDQYLAVNSSFQRLYDEYKKYGSLVIAYDFDNTVYDFHSGGHTYTEVIELLRDLKSLGCFLTVWTANSDEQLVAQYLHMNEIPFDAINENPPFWKGTERKIYYNALLDDRAGLAQVFSELRQLVTIISFETKKA